MEHNKQIKVDLCHQVLIGDMPHPAMKWVGVQPHENDLHVECDEAIDFADWQAAYLLNFNAMARIDCLESGIRNLHKVRGRHHTQKACEALFALVGLENNIGVEVGNGCD